jgi:hypothetical protein
MHPGRRAVEPHFHTCTPTTRGHAREVPANLSKGTQAILAALVLLAGERKGNAAFALADLLSRQGLERPCETLVAWGREA